MDNKKPKLDFNIHLQDLSEFYWTKKELQQFAKKLDLSTQGGKMDLLKRIQLFLKTGKKEVSLNRAQNPSSFSSCPRGPFNMQTRVGSHFRCTREIRDFFEKHLGKNFHFSVTLQKFIQSNPLITFQQIADEWSRLKNLKKAGQKETIGAQFEYNQFTRDFFLDPENQGKSRKDCVNAWKKIRSLRGSRQYKKAND